MPQTAYVRLHVCLYVCLYVCVYVYLYVCLYVCFCVCLLVRPDATDSIPPDAAILDVLTKLKVDVRVLPE